MATSRCALVDAGADVHGVGDVHQLEVIGWASFSHAPDAGPRRMDATRRAVVDLLTARGARHHVFSAMCVGDPELIRHVVEDNADSLDRRLSRFEGGQTPLHFAMTLEPARGEGKGDSH